MSVKEGYMCRCACNNLYLPTGKLICPDCNLIKKLDKLSRLATAMEKRRTAKRLTQLNKKKEVIRIVSTAALVKPRTKAYRLIEGYTPTIKLK